VARGQQVEVEKQLVAAALGLQGRAL